MFLGKNERGDYILDADETPPSAGELLRAEEYLQTWEGAIRQRRKPPAGPCPHEDFPCTSRRECLGKIAWWRRYVLEIETCERGNA